MNMPQEHKPSPAKKKQQHEKMPGMPGMNMQPGGESDFAIAHSHTASGSGQCVPASWIAVAELVDRHDPHAGDPVFHRGVEGVDPVPGAALDPITT